MCAWEERICNACVYLPRDVFAMSVVIGRKRTYAYTCRGCYTRAKLHARTYNITLFVMLGIRDNTYLEMSSQGQWSSDENVRNATVTRVLINYVTLVGPPRT